MLGLPARSVKTVTRVTTINKSTQAVNTYSCQLFLDSFKIPYRGFIFFLWSNQQAQIQSLRYESQGKTVKIKQTLTLSMRVTSRNGREALLTTSLKLLTEKGELLDEIQISINDLQGQFKEIEAPMKGGLLVMKVRRKVMNIGAGLQDQSVNYTRSLYKSRGRIQQKSFADEYETLQEELNRIKKQLEDQVYLNNKLKNDRDVLLSTKQELQIQIETLLMQVTKQVSTLRQHYQNRLAIRDHTYQQEIQSLISDFNSNAQQSKKVMETVMKQKMKLQQQVKPLNLKIKQLEESQKAYKIKFQQNALEKQGLMGRLGKLENDLKDKDQSIKRLEAQKQEMNRKFDQLKVKCSDLQQNITIHLTTINQQNSTSAGYQQKVKSLEQQLKNKNARISQLEEELIRRKANQETLIKDKQMRERRAGMKEQEKKALEAQLQALKTKLQENECQMEFNQNVMGQLKTQQGDKQQELYAQLQRLEHLYTQKIEQLMNTSRIDKQNLNNEKVKLQIRVKQLQGNLQGSQLKVSQLDVQMSDLHNQLNANRNETNNKNNQLVALQKQVQKLKAQNQELQQQLKNAANMSREDLQKLAKSRAKSVKQEETKRMSHSELLAEVKRLTEMNESLIEQIQNLKKKNASLSEQLGKKGKSDDAPPSPILKRRRSKQEVQSEDGSSRSLLQQILTQKNRQICQLRVRVEQLQGLYRFMMAKIDKILERYPNVDIQKIEAQVPIPQLPKVTEWCESQQQQEKQLIKKVSDGDPSQKLSMQKKMSMGIGVGGFQPIEEKHKQERSEGQVRRGLMRNNSLGMATNIGKGEGKPDDKNFLPKNQSDNMSRYSSTSYKKVSHTQRIKELEDLVNQLRQREKMLEKQLESRGVSIKLIENNDTKKISESRHTPPKHQDKHHLTLQQQQKLKQAVADAAAREQQIKKIQLQLEDRLKNQLQQQAKDKLQFQKTKYQLDRQRQDLDKERQEREKQRQDHQGKLAENHKKIQQLQKQIKGMSEIISKFEKDAADWEQKLRKQKQATQEAKLQFKQLTLNFDNVSNELKKSKNIIQNLQEKLKKMSGNDLLIRELSKEIEDLNKKCLQMTRIQNHMKLQKDAIEQELRLLKKKQGDHARLANQWQQKAASLERALDQARKRQSRLKRQVEEAQEDIRRVKLLAKKSQDQVQTFSSIQLGWQAQRRKLMDDISSHQDQLSRKDYDISRLNKQLQKWKQRAQQKEQMRMGKKIQLRDQIQRLQSELIRRDKRLLQEGQQNKLLRGRLQLLERQNKRILQQKNQSYSEKLRYYVDQMNSIKKLLEEYQNQNGRLKVQNSQIYQQSETLRVALERTQNKNDQAIQRQQSILNDLQQYINDNQFLRNQIGRLTQQLEQAQGVVFSLRKEVDESILQIRKLEDKLDNSQRNLQRALNDQRDYKVKISQLMTQQQIIGKIGEKYKLSQRRRTQLQEQCRRLKVQLQNTINIFIYKRQDMQKAVAQARAYQRKLKEEELLKLSNDSGKQLASKIQRLQQQVMDVYNENNRLRNDLTAALDQNVKIKALNVQFETIASRVGPLQTQLQTFRNNIQLLKEQLRKKEERAARAETAADAMASQNALKQKQIKTFKTKIQELQQTLNKLNEENLGRKRIQRQLQDTISRIQTNLERQKADWQHNLKQKQQQLMQQYKAKIIDLEGQLQRTKDKQLRISEQNSAKMKKLQGKMDQMQEALREKEKTMQGHYQAQAHELQSSLLRLSQELEGKLLRIQELNEAIIILQNQNKDIAAQLEATKQRYDEQTLLRDEELNKLRNKMKEDQNTYTTAIKKLQEQINKAQSQIQAAKNLPSNSRINQQDRIAKRYEEKLKAKDKKIEQMKQNMYTLQETVVRLKKKQSNQESGLIEIDKLKKYIIEIENTKKILQKKLQDQINNGAKTNESLRDLKRSLLSSKQIEQRSNLLLQQKQLQIQSMSCQLKTLKELYTQLQKQLQKRKNNLALQLEQGNTLQIELRNQQQRIIKLQQQLMNSNKQIKDLELQLKRKQAEIRKNNQIIQEMRATQQGYKQQIVSINKQLQRMKKCFQDETTTSQSIKVQLRQSHVQINRLRKNHDELRINCQSKQDAVSQLQRINQQLAVRWRNSQDVFRMYNNINDRARQEVGCNIEQLLDHFIRLRQQNETQIEQLIEEIEQLKFLNDRKFLDYDDMKRQNIQLQIKIEDLDVLNEQLTNLRQVCDKLQEQKKNSNFREDILRLQLQNLAMTAPQIRHRIEAILTAPQSSNYASFSFY